MKHFTLVSALSFALLGGAAHAFTPGPHADPEAQRLAKALDFALIQALAEHHACVSAEAALGAELKTLKAALAAKDAAAARESASGIGLRVQWVLGLEERAGKSRAAVNAIDDEIHKTNVALGDQVFSGKATRAVLDRAMDFGALEQEMLEDAGFRELSIQGDMRVWETAATMVELQRVLPEVEALVGPRGPALELAPL